MDSLYKKLLNGTTEETTTSGDIAYAPQMLAPPVTPAPMYPAKKKKKRKKANEALFEDIDEQVNNVQIEILTEFNKIISQSGLTIDKFVNKFGMKSNITANNVLSRYGYALDTMRLKEALPYELGENEMILDAISNKQSLSRFEYTNEYPYLYGGKLKAVMNGVTLTYDGYIESGYNEFEQITIDDSDVIKLIDDELVGIKISGNTIFPTNQRFDDNFYTELKDIILSHDDEEPEKEETDNTKPSGIRSRATRSRADRSRAKRGLSYG